MRLADQVAVKPRFARSANVERDLGAAAINGYLPTGRALDVVARIGRGLLNSPAGRALAITGPHGSGKSSLAVFLHALFAPRESGERRAAWEVLRAADPGVAAVFDQGLAAVDAQGRGAARAFAVAAHEPVTVTVARALYAGAQRALGNGQTLVPATFGQDEAARHLTAREVRNVVATLCAVQPVVLVIDEFGKNLEAFASSGREGDPYLLQSLAEAAQGEDPLPLMVITMQHLAFEEHAQGASVAMRREWVKVQGRFQDVPYVEASRDTWRLIGAAVETSPGPLAAAVSLWYESNRDALAGCGLRELWVSAQRCYPLHPLAVAVLPELCSRYGQNERTLFSFMAGTEPLAVPAFLTATEWTGDEPVPFVGLDRVYDYFLDSASSTVSASATVSRWLEIETRIRDTVGLSGEQLRVLKCIGVLNLVSSGGILRASRHILELGTAHGAANPATIDDLDAVLEKLEAAGLITYRSFADEYRVWQGSDFDIEGAISAARRACRDRSLADLLNEAAALEPAVAGRHSQRTGVLRIFDQRFSELGDDDLTPPGASEPWDGRVLYATAATPPADRAWRGHDKPVVVVVPEGVGTVEDVAIEAAALRMALSSAQVGNVDWVARRELVERAADAEKSLRREIAATWNPAASTWYLQGQIDPLPAGGGLSAALSEAADRKFWATPRVANEMIARRELTSQGAKARRMLLEAFIANPAEECFGIQGYGPDRAIYEAVYRSTGLHRLDKKSLGWVITRPKDEDWARAWSEIQDCLDEAADQRINLADIGELLKLPPIGLKDGILPVLLVSALVARADEVALYEHGSLVLRLDDAVAERLARNPGHFTVKNNAAAAGSRKLVVVAVAERLGLASGTVQPTFMRVARSLYRELQSLPLFTQQTRRYVSMEAAGVLQAFKTAAEPDTLIFETLPVLLRCRAFSANASVTRKDADAFAAALADVLDQLRAAYRHLLDEVWDLLAEATAVRGGQAEVAARLAAQAIALQDRVLEPRLKAFVGAIVRPLNGDAWIENVAMVVADGQAPRTWTDELAARFGLLIAELGGAFRRVQALLYDRLAVSDDAYRSRRLTLTRPDGFETSHVLVLAEHDRAVVSEQLDPMLDVLARIYGSRAAARQTVMAHLATDEDVISSADAPVDRLAKEACDER
jgi:hypothetical protein